MVEEDLVRLLVSIRSSLERQFESNPENLSFYLSNRRSIDRVILSYFDGAIKSRYNHISNNSSLEIDLNSFDNGMVLFPPEGTSVLRIIRDDKGIDIDIEYEVAKALANTGIYEETVISFLRGLEGCIVAPPSTTFDNPGIRFDLDNSHIFGLENLALFPNLLKSISIKESISEEDAVRISVIQIEELLFDLLERIPYASSSIEVEKDLNVIVTGLSILARNSHMFNRSDRDKMVSMIRTTMTIINDQKDAKYEKECLLREKLRLNKSTALNSTLFQNTIFNIYVRNISEFDESTDLENTILKKLPFLRDIIKDDTLIMIVIENKIKQMRATYRIHNSRNMLPTEPVVRSFLSELMQEDFNEPLPVLIDLCHEYIEEMIHLYKKSGKDIKKLIERAVSINLIGLHNEQLDDILIKLTGINREDTEINTYREYFKGELTPDIVESRYIEYGNVSIENYDRDKLKEQILQRLMSNNVDIRDVLYQGKLREHLSYDRELFLDFNLISRIEASFKDDADVNIDRYLNEIGNPYYRQIYDHLLNCDKFTPVDYLTLEDFLVYIKSDLFSDRELGSAKEYILIQDFVKKFRAKIPDDRLSIFADFLETDKPFEPEVCLDSLAQSRLEIEIVTEYEKVSNDERSYNNPVLFNLVLDSERGRESFRRHDGSFIPLVTKVMMKAIKNKKNFRYLGDSRSTIYYTPDLGSFNLANVGNANRRSIGYNTKDKCGYIIKANNSNVYGLVEVFISGNHAGQISSIRQCNGIRTAEKIRLTRKIDPEVDRYVDNVELLSRRVS